MNNAQMEPEQVLVISTNTGVTEAEIKKSLSVVVLPEAALGGYEQEQRAVQLCAGARSTKVLAASRPVRIEQIPNEKSFRRHQSFRYVSEVGAVL